MNHFIVFAIAFVFAITVADNYADTIDNSENLVSSAINRAVAAGEELYPTENEQVKEEELTEAIGDLISYFSKSIVDMSNMSEDIKNVGESASENVRNNLVDNVLSYMEDSELMNQQIDRMMTLRNEFQDSILKQLSSLPISTEDALKIKSDLIEQLNLRSNTLPEKVQGLMDLPQFPQRASKFIPQLNRN